MSGGERVDVVRTVSAVVVVVSCVNTVFVLCCDDDVVVVLCCDVVVVGNVNEDNATSQMSLTSIVRSDRVSEVETAIT